MGARQLRTWFHALREWARAPARAKRLRAARAWKQAVLRCLLEEVLNPDTPVYVDAVPSFLQPEGRIDLTEPRRLDLLAPELLLALDILGPESDPDRRIGEAYLSAPAWERRQAQLAQRAVLLHAHPQLRYVRVRHTQAVDPHSLRALLLAELGQL